MHVGQPGRQLARGTRALLLLALFFCQREGGREARAAHSGGAVAWADSANAQMFAVVRLRGGAAKDQEADSEEGSEQTRSATTGSDTSMRDDSDASMREEAEDTGPLSAEQLAQLRALSVAELIPLCELIAPICPPYPPRSRALPLNPRPVGPRSAICVVRCMCVCVCVCACVRAYACACV
jgi:hypothetical protein